MINTVVVFCAFCSNAEDRRLRSGFSPSCDYRFLKGSAALIYFLQLSKCFNHQPSAAGGRCYILCLWKGKTLRVGACISLA